MTVVNVLSIPSHPTYGFDGVTEDEFNEYNDRLDRVLEQSKLEYRGEFAPRTDCACWLWSDHEIEWRWSGLSYEAYTGDEDTINDISEWFFENIICRYDFFSEMSNELVVEIACQINDYL